VFAFADIAKASSARVDAVSFGLLDMLLELRRTKWVALNVVGILRIPGRGGNALLYSESKGRSASASLNTQPYIRSRKALLICGVIWQV